MRPFTSALATAAPVKKRWRTPLEKFNPNHEPAGTPEGGQFAEGPGGGAGSEITEMSLRSPYSAVPRTVRVAVNPSEDDAKRIAIAAPYRDIRLLRATNGNIYVWASGDAVHNSVSEAIGYTGQKAAEFGYRNGRFFPLRDGELASGLPLSADAKAEWFRAPHAKFAKRRFGRSIKQIAKCQHMKHDLRTLHGARLVKSWRTPIEKAASDPYAYLHQIADHGVPEVMRRFLAATRNLRATPNEIALQDAVASGDMDAVLEALGFDGSAFSGYILPALGDVVDEAGKATFETDYGLAARAGRLAIRFDMINPHTVYAVRDFGGDLITQITEDTRDAIRDIVAYAMEYGGHPYQQARQIRNLIGLTSEQMGAVDNFRTMLESGDRTALSRTLRDARFDGTLDRALGFQPSLELAPEQIGRMVSRYADRMLDARAVNIARTETMRAANLGQNEAWYQAVQGGLLKPGLTRAWLVTPDDRLCEFCAAIPGMNPDGVGLDGMFDTPFGPVDMPPLHPQCFPGDTLVAASSRIMGYSCRWFDGNLAVVRAASGNELSCTVNHPILTRRGWVAAGALKKGDDLIGGAFAEGFGFANTDSKDAPTAIHEIAETLRRSGKMASAPVPVAPEDFHGDGEGSKVAIIGSDRLLRDRLHAACAKHRRQFALALADIRQRSFHMNGMFEFPPKAFALAANGVVGGTDLPRALDDAHAAPFQHLGFDRPTDRHAAFDQVACNRNAADAMLARKLVQGDAGQIAFDEIVAVRRKPFRGHVYNLETSKGWYVANGAIVHNCRCVTIIQDFGDTQKRDMRKKTRAAVR